MRHTLTSTVIGALIGATLTCGAVVAATSQGSGATACVNRHHILALLHHGGCSKGFTKTTLGQRGPRGPRGLRGKTGPQGPGVNSEVINLAPSASQDFPTVKGVSTTAVCGASDVEIQLNTLAGGATYTIFGTQESDGADGPTTGNNITGLTPSGNNAAGLDFTIRAGTGPLIHLTIGGLRVAGGCEYVFTATPTTPIS